MSETKKGFIGLVVGTLRSPQLTLEQINQDYLLKSLIIIVVLAILNMVSASIYISKIPIELYIPQIGQAGVDVSMVSQSFGTISAIMGIVRTTYSYVLPVLLIHIIATLTGGQGTLKRTFTLNGFASIPLIIQQLFRVVDSLVTSAKSLTSYQLYMLEINGRLLKILASMNIFTVFGIATLVLIGYGIAVNYGTSRRKGLIIASVPYALSFALSLYFVT
jgi:hypothetical protein